MDMQKRGWMVSSIVIRLKKIHCLLSVKDTGKTSDDTLSNNEKGEYEVGHKRYSNNHHIIF